VLLGSAAFGGTLAAVRDLDKRGFEVFIVSSHLLGAAAWSRHAARVRSAPPESQGERFIERLIAIGAADPGHILLPTSDETAWLYAENAARLERHFRLYQPSIASLRRILDKKLFSEAAAVAGLGVLPSWSPRTIDDVVALAPNLTYPILIKPRTNVHRLRTNKGMVAPSATELIVQYRRFVDHEKTAATVNPVLSQANLPILQPFVRVGSEGVHSVTGFIDRTGELFVTRAATKVLQRSQPVGVGVCFESRPSVSALSSAVRRLCCELGYFGLFEVEFVRFDGGWAAIDFNPRLFNQIGMDIRRGMPLPLFACLDAAGENGPLREAVARAQAEADQPMVFSDRFTLRALLLAQTLTARVSSEDRARWHAWINEHVDHAVDFAVDNSDPVPGLIHAMSEIYLGLKSFPRFMRTTKRVSTLTSRFSKSKHGK
jgi:D-aspartate ligase